MSSLSLITPPSQEPVSLAEVKAQLRLETDADDALLAALIVTARSVAESLTGRALLAQTWRLYLDQPPTQRYLLLPKAPLLSVAQVCSYDEADNLTVFASSAYLVDTASQPGRLVLRGLYSWPQFLRSANGLEVTYTAGYGSEAAQVPAAIRQGLLAHIAHLYQHRGDYLSPDGQMQVAVQAGLPSLTLSLYAPYRLLSLGGEVGL